MPAEPQRTQRSGKRRASAGCPEMRQDTPLDWHTALPLTSSPSHFPPRPAPLSASLYAGPDSGPEASHSSPAASAAGGARPAMNPAAGAAAVAKVASILEADTDETDLLDTEGPILDVKGNPIPAEDIERVRNLRSQFHAMKQHMIDELREEGLVQEVAAVDYSGGGGGGGGGPSSGGFGADGGFGGGGGGMGMGDDGDPGPRRPPLSSKQQRALSQQAVVARGEHNCMVALRESGVVQMSP